MFRRTSLIVLSLLLLVALATAAAAQPGKGDCNENQVKICHQAGQGGKGGPEGKGGPGGPPADAGGGKFITLCVDENSEQPHLDHGDHQATVFWSDPDGDGWGSGEGTEECEQPAGSADKDGDCDEGNASTNPGVDEQCGDNVDNNCNGEVDEDCVQKSPTVDVLLHCSSGSQVIGSYGPGQHQLPWNVRRNISYVKFEGHTVDLIQCGTNQTHTLTESTNLCALPGGCCGAGRWNDSVCSIVVR